MGTFLKSFDTDFLIRAIVSEGDDGTRGSPWMLRRTGGRDGVCRKPVCSRGPASFRGSPGHAPPRHRIEDVAEPTPTLLRPDLFAGKGTLGQHRRREKLRLETTKPADQTAQTLGSGRVNRSPDASPRTSAGRCDVRCTLRLAAPPRHRTPRWAAFPVRRPTRGHRHGLGRR